MENFLSCIVEIVISEFGPKELLRRISDPIWFQALGCASGFDWHSSGLTTTLCAALKKAVSNLGDDCGIAVCGGKGKNAFETPKEVTSYCERWGIDADSLTNMSRLCAKVDTVLLQDGYDLYHHTFIFSKDGSWAVIQQGMNLSTKTARRYQWFSKENLDPLCEPHTGITSDLRMLVLNLLDKSSRGCKDSILDFLKNPFDKILKTMQKVSLSMPKRHYISPEDVDISKLRKVLEIVHESNVKNFLDLIKVRGVGKRVISSLCLVSELIYKTPPSYNDPARFSFAHGGKDGHPFPVDRKTFDETIGFLKDAIDKAKMGGREKLEALRRLSNLIP